MDGDALSPATMCLDRAPPHGSILPKPENHHTRNPEWHEASQVGRRADMPASYRNPASGFQPKLALLGFCFSWDVDECRCSYGKRSAARCIALIPYGNREALFPALLGGISRSSSSARVRGT